MKTNNATHTPDLMYIVERNPFHARYDWEQVYRGRSLPQAIRAARREDCHDCCCCGGPRLMAEHNNGDHIALAYNWHAARPF